MPEVRADSVATVRLLERVAQGDRQALDDLLAQHRPALKSFIEARLGPQFRKRFDSSDVVQEAQMEVARRMDDYLSRRPMPFHLWVRRTAYERLLTMRRAQLRKGRTPDREAALPEHSSLLLARPLLAAAPTPSQAIEARELADRIALAIDALDEADREVLLMRHVEDLPYEEIAGLLGIEAAAARKRYGRALIRLQKALTDAGLLE
jgi:RNA polymerase sigma-70 factor (ECF subfamily)